MKLLKQHWYVILIAALSFYFFSSLRYPLLNSDSAINILMIADYSWPQNIYAWGQNRMGTLIPLLAQPFYHLGLSVLWCESLVHYSILILGCFCFIKFFKQTLFKVLFTLVWFFPISHMIDHTQFAYGIQMSLFGLMLYLTYFVWPACHSFIQKSGLVFSLFLLSIISTWVSDISVALVGLWTLMILIVGLIKYKVTYLKKHVVLWVVFIVCFMVTYLLINGSKVFSTQQYSYYLLASISHIIKNGAVFFTSFTTIPLLFLIIPILTFKSKNTIGTMAISSGVLLALCILCFQWTYLNNVPRRYFTPSFILISWGFLLNYDSKCININLRLIINNWYKQNTFYLILLVLVCGCSSIYEMKFVSPKTLKPRANYNNEYTALGKIGIVAEYWNAYINCVNNPKQIVATPHQGCEIKNPDMVDSVFVQPKIFLIKDCWLNEYPDTIIQFNRKLVKNGNPFTMANSNLCEYKVLK